MSTPLLNFKVPNSCKVAVHTNKFVPHNFKSNTKYYMIISGGRIIRMKVNGTTCNSGSFELQPGEKVRLSAVAFYLPNPLLVRYFCYKEGSHGRHDVSSKI